VPATEFEQPARRIGGGGRGRLGLAVWAAALAGIVGFGVLGRPGNGTATDESVAAVSASPQPTEKAEPLLVLTEPTTQEVTSIAVHIRGRVTEPVHRVQLFLRVGRAAAASQIVRPTSNGLFGAVFTLPGPRSAGEGAIRAVGLDGFGMPLGSVNRSFKAIWRSANFFPSGSWPSIWAFRKHPYARR
jgi:hypothetical protein